MTTATPVASFTNQTFQSQSAFHVIMKAMAEPGRIFTAPEPIDAPKPLGPVAAMVALTLCDYDTDIWLDTQLAASDAVRHFLKFQTGAPITSQPGNAKFAFVSDPNEIDKFDRFALGSDEYPDQSTTLVISVDTMTNTRGKTLAGPGIEKTRPFSTTPLPANFWSMVKANHTHYPRGVDLIFCSTTSIACLPRSTRIVED